MVCPRVAFVFLAYLPAESWSHPASSRNQKRLVLRNESLGLYVTSERPQRTLC